MARKLLYRLTMKKFIRHGLVLFLLLGGTIAISPFFEGARVMASGISFPGSQFAISEPFGLLILGVGIVGLARIGRKRFLKPLDNPKGANK